MHVTNRMKDIGIGLLIGLFFTVLEMIVTYWIVNEHRKKKVV